MTTLYLIANNCFIDDLIIYKNFVDEEKKKKNRPLTTEGEKEALKIVKKIGNIDSVFSSTYYSAIDSAKYTIEKNDTDLIVDANFDDRKLGILKDTSINLRNLQEHDFTYKLENGESLDDVKKRMRESIKEILNNREGENIAIYTHNIPMISLLSIWCNKDFNMDEKLMLTYEDNVIIDGLHNKSLIIKLIFEKDKLLKIEKVI
ncbi:MAG: histidine phosphatase family protein [Firmicutes bacterium]|nr:histidine phosphatase family protein [Bacillota bacterium]